MPPTRSTGTPASSKAFSTPMCEQPLQGGGHPGQAGHQPGPSPRTPSSSHLPRRRLAPPTRWSRPHLAPPPPSTRAMVFPVSTRAKREKSLCRSARLEKTFS